MKARLMKAGLAGLLILLAGCLSACDAGEFVVDPGVNSRDVTIARDVVILRDPAATVAFNSVTADDWVFRQADVLRNWKDAIEVRRYTIRPGERADAFAVPRRGLRGVIIFTVSVDGSAPSKRSLPLD